MKKKKMSENLDEAGRIYQSIFRHSPLAILYLDWKGSIRECNEKAAAIMGGTSEEFRNFPFIEKIDNGILVACIVRACQGHEEYYEGDYETPGGGKKFYIKAWFSGVKGRNGNLTGAIGIIDDITRQHRTEMALEETRRTFSTLLGNLPGMAYRCRNDESRTMEFVSQGCRELTGHSSEDLLLNNSVAYGDLIFEVDRPYVSEAIKDAVNSHSGFRLPYRLKTADGELKWLWEQGCGIYNEFGELVAVEGFISDISELKKSEYELKLSEERFLKAFDSNPGMMAIIRLSDMAIVSVNESFIRNFGYAKSELLGRHLFAGGLIPDEREQHVILRNAIEKRLPIRNLEVRIGAKSGGCITGLISGEHITIAGEDCLLLSGFDITERKETERFLRESEQRFRKIFEDAPIAFWEVDFADLKQHLRKLGDNGVENLKDYLLEKPEHVLECIRFIRLVNVNNTAVQLYAAKSKKYLMENFERLIGSESINALRHILHAVIDKRMFFEIETVNWTLKREKKYVYLKGIVIPGHEEQYSGILVSVIDITHRRLAEQALQIKHDVLQTTLKYQELVSNLALNLNAVTTFKDNIESLLQNIGFTLNANAVVLCQYESRGDVFRRIAGWQDDRLNLGNTHESGGPFLKMPHIAKKIINGKIFIQSDILRIGKEAEDYFRSREINSFAIIPVGQERNFLGALCLFNKEQKKWRFEDYKLFETLASLIEHAWERQNLLEARLDAERKKAEADQLAERAARLASLGTLTAGISHEINQPLAALKMVSDGALYWLKKNDTLSVQDITEDLSEISLQASRIDNIIKHMRTLTKPEQTMTRETVRLNEIIERIFALIGAQLASHKITVDRELDTSLPAIETIPTLLEQIGINLVINAMQALDASGEREKIITVKTGMADNCCILEIMDNGPGIPPENMNRVFDPFFTTKIGSEGMGLGLSIVQNFVSVLGGLISVKNRDGGGAHFTVSLPIQAG